MPVPLSSMVIFAVSSSEYIEISIFVECFSALLIKFDKALSKACGLILVVIEAFTILVLMSYLEHLFLMKSEIHLPISIF